MCAHRQVSSLMGKLVQQQGQLTSSQNTMTAVLNDVPFPCFSEVRGGGSSA